MIMRLYGINGLDTVDCDLGNDGFALEHVSYDIENKCTSDWYCEKHDVEVDEIEDDVMAADEFCHACRRLVGRNHVVRFLEIAGVDLVDDDRGRGLCYLQGRWRLRDDIQRKMVRTCQAEVLPVSETGA